MRPKIIIAGPGAGKTFNMVQAVLDKLKDLSPSRYLVVITYTNSATQNIRSRLAKKIVPPPNLFIGTIHSFLNRFIVIPFSSLHDSAIGKEKIFIQCQTDDVFESVRKYNGRTYDQKAAAIAKAKIKERLNNKGYISFDQTIALAKDCITNPEISRILSNRIQYLFLDEFQDTNNAVFGIIDSIRKQRKTQIYCVGDPEQFIHSFDMISKVFTNIPILKSIQGSTFDVEFNTANHRCSQKIVNFLNLFNGRNVRGEVFQQLCSTGEIGESVKFITATGNATSILSKFTEICDAASIAVRERCVIAKRNEVVTRIIAALNNNFLHPGKRIGGSSIKTVIDTLLSSINMTQSMFYERYKTDVMTLRKHAVLILKAIQNGVIHDENTFGNFVRQELHLELNPGVPVRVENIRVQFNSNSLGTAITVSNIHTIKGLEAEAVLAIAKTQEELLLWIETDRQIRENHRGKEKTDYPRLGYVAFSRAKKVLCIACLEAVSAGTLAKLMQLGVEPYPSFSDGLDCN